MTAKSEQALLEAVKQRLAGKYAQLPAQRVEAAVDSAYASFADCRIRDFVPLLVERHATSELAKSATGS